LPNAAAGGTATVVLVAVVAEAVDAVEDIEDVEACDGALLVTGVGDTAVVELGAGPLCADADEAELHAAVLNATAATTAAAMAVTAREVRTSGRLEDTRRD
jgi:hypothetical protein